MQTAKPNDPVLNWKKPEKIGKKGKLSRTCMGFKNRTDNLTKPNQIQHYGTKSTTET
jgi:hypothetical protein